MDLVLFGEDSGMYGTMTSIIVYILKALVRLKPLNLAQLRLEFQVRDGTVQRLVKKKRKFNFFEGA